MAPPLIYRNVESVLSVLNNYKLDNLQAVTTLLQVYNNALNATTQSPNTKRQPLIVLEGLDGCGKSTTAFKLAKKLNAVKWCTPPESIKPFRHLFDDHPQLRTAYYALGNYIAALEVSEVLKIQPVVMDRFWHSTAAYAIAQAVRDFPEDVKMPPTGDSFYRWPDDLFKPSVVLFLDVSETVRTERLSRRIQSTTQENLLKSEKIFRDNVVLAYKNMVDPPVVFINSNPGMKTVLIDINDKIKHLFQK